MLYTPYSYDGPFEPTSEAQNLNELAVGDLLGASDLLVSSDGTAVPSSESRRHSTEGEASTRPRRRVKKRFDKVGGENSATPEVFVFEFGVVVCWGMTETQEKRFLSSMCISSHVFCAPRFVLFMHSHLDGVSRLNGSVSEHQGLLLSCTN